MIRLSRSHSLGVVSGEDCPVDSVNPVLPVPQREALARTSAGGRQADFAASHPSIGQSDAATEAIRVRDRRACGSRDNPITQPSPHRMIRGAESRIGLVFRFLLKLKTAIGQAFHQSANDHAADCRCPVCCDVGFCVGPEFGAGGETGPTILRFGPPVIRYFDGPICRDCHLSVIECRCSQGDA